MHKHDPIENYGFLWLSAICMVIALLSITSAFAQSSGNTPAAPNKAPDNSPQSNSLEKPAFDDVPHFTVSGVKDTSALGGHGSDTMTRAHDSLAKETVVLGKSDSASKPANSVAALESLKQKAERDPQNAAIHHMLADAEEKSNDSLAAVREYQRAAELEAREDYFFDWGAELLLHHAPEPAIEVFTKGHRFAPESERMLIGLGAAEFTLGQLDEAANHIGEASDLNTNDPTPYLFLGKMLAAEATASDAMTEKLHRFTTLQPDNAIANYFYALALWKRRKASPEAVTRVETLLNRAIQLDPKCDVAYVLLGIVHSEQGEDAKAISDFQKAVSIDANMEEAHYRLAQAYRRVGQEDKAKAEINIYEALIKESEQQDERERHEIRQFVYTLRDPSSSMH
jgi:tetratricopeptide (TPR) repeat protein